MANNINTPQYIYSKNKGLVAANSLNNVIPSNIPSNNFYPNNQNQNDLQTETNKLKEMNIYLN